MIELSKCPFCGGEAIFHTTSEFRKNSEQGFYFKIKCTRCGIVYPLEGKVSVQLEERGTLRYTEDNRLELASKWNSRIIEEAAPDGATTMTGNTKRKGTPIEGNNESYNCENWIP